MSMFERVTRCVGRLAIHVPLADELALMHHKCVAGGCSRASGGIDLWVEATVAASFPKER